MEASVKGETGTAPRIAGVSGDVTRVQITQEFAFDDFTIFVEGVPAYRDDATGKQYVPGPVAVAISDAVMHLAEAVQQARAAQPEPQQRWLRRITISVPDLADPAA